ncbi:MAG: DNA repair protein RadA [Candidatus Buchananbacteria bacterium RIFCSPHIGHO2_02_FULL_40_13]|uniref:DNA repair protein RadA n=1 Tax=Candidatus Buchananbacteria bacterium RIFCSPLOWO2_01_FULL_39_33 TaxID=1797543 RepID=A0A1G1YGM4_9BACT|nr:MAG: DNA repair protein RadA [Candidatus Buchananbacteria bacterium RIFCSPHIGHO2_01_FULL_40_35]OGY50194.1 MAG: DNA repair protein RadA [Candidatus Buchananbacteria bacterium RIFCSPHIGHO2_02_FULL_40_13]OGY51449.1 MAG: DNA repair protein RadA [Candidatus Buchananbacteria bacterium RIFCSPLOWO2_01_FULL_39_33]
MPNNVFTIHSCSNCGAQYPKWQGRCNECGAWGTISQESQNIENKKTVKISSDQPINFQEIGLAEKTRFKTGLEEVDRVLGGGLVVGSLVLLGGDPGVGKSTLALQIAQSVGGALYISGEESANQIKMRADRLKADLADLKFIPQTGIEKIIATILDQKPKLAVIDSIQTVNSAESTTGFGSAAQIISCTSQLMALAKKSNIPIIIVGHVTKEGYVAGPKTLEHLVDTVLYLENDSRDFYKILRGVKNRFGSIGEIGVFEMTAIGLKEVVNPTNIFMESCNLPIAGTAISIIMEGSRAFLVEIQALASKTVFGYPQRKATGFDLNRLQMIIAVISKIAKINLSNHDIYLNVAGGLKVKETATDLATGLAIISAFLEKPISRDTLILGEIGLSGEIRTIAQIERRIKEAAKLKFNKVITAKNSAISNISGVEIIPVANIGEAIRIIA